MDAEFILISLVHYKISFFFVSSALNQLDDRKNKNVFVY